MIIEFSVENYRSFKDPVELNLVASREQNHGERLPFLDRKYDFRVNPVAAIYGGNASGKSNLTKALASLQKLIHETTVRTKSLPHTPFKLDPACLKQPTVYRLIFLHQGTLFEYEIAHTAISIASESLTKIKSKSEETIFRRVGNEVVEGSVIEDPLFPMITETLPQRLPFVSLIAPISLGRSGALGDAATPFHWLFNLLVVPPGGFVDGLISSTDVFDCPSVELIGAGIEDRRLDKIDPDEIGATEDDLAAWAADLEIGDQGRVAHPSGRRLIAVNEPGGLALYEEKFLHSSPSGPVEFNWSEESDGTMAFAELHPFFKELARPGSEKILVVDEIDRSFHSVLILELIKAYLGTCNKDSRSQLVFTTHDLLLMDIDEFRRDEIWVMEKDSDASSTLVSLAEYKGVRKDSDLRKLYLQGRFGGTPNVAPLQLTWSEDSQNV